MLCIGSLSPKAMTAIVAIAAIAVYFVYPVYQIYKQKTARSFSGTGGR